MHFTCAHIHAIQRHNKYNRSNVWLFVINNAAYKCICNKGLQMHVCSLTRSPVKDTFRKEKVK